MEIFARGLELEFGKAVASASWGAGGFLAVRGERRCAVSKSVGRSDAVQRIFLLFF
jgi:hypothetical protein